MAKKSKYDVIRPEINWSNYECNDEAGNKTGFWEVSEVLYSKIEALKDEIRNNEVIKAELQRVELLDETSDLLKMLQVFVTGITDKQLKKMAVK